MTDSRRHFDDGYPSWDSSSRAGEPADRPSRPPPSRTAGPRGRQPRTPQSRMMPASAFVLALLLAAGIVLGSVLALRDEPAAGSSCEGGVGLRVMTSAKLAPVVSKIAETFRSTSSESDGRCVAVTVTPRSSVDTVATLSGGWTDPAAGPAPDIWIPESASWLALARASAEGARLLPETGTTVATSPVVVAVPRPAAEALGWPQTPVSWLSVVQNSGNEQFWSTRGHPEWGPFRVGLPDPASSSAGLDSVLNTVSGQAGVPVEQITPETLRAAGPRQAILTLERGAERIEATDSLLAGMRDVEAAGPSTSYLSAFPISESDLVGYNRGHVPEASAATPPATPLVGFYPTDGVTLEKVSYVVLDATTHDPSRAKAGAAFLAAIQATTGQQALAAAGWRAPDGTSTALGADVGVIDALPQAPRADANGAALGAAAETFRGVHQRDATLVVVDSSRSMGTTVPGSGGKTRLSLLDEAAADAMPLISDDSEVGLWQFATGLDGDRDWNELCPVGPLNEQIEGVTRREYLGARYETIEPARDSGLYDTALAAFRKVSLEYAPGKVNQVVLVTDGVDDDLNGISLAELLTTLRAEFKPDNPVHVVTIAYGADADPAALRQISDATGAASYTSADPNDISQVLADALWYG